MTQQTPFKCPRCGDISKIPPALSRTDNKTRICSDCGRFEALEQFVNALTPQTDWVANNFNADFPLLPYADTSGWSGSETSKARAIAEDSDGTTSKRQKDTIKALAGAGILGLTWKELASHFGWHHGQATSVLSVLHLENRINRLVEKRSRSAVYVLPEFVNERQTSPHGRKKRIHTCSNCGHTEES